jgi:hypothetical protein
MTAIAPYRSGVAPGRAGFVPLLRAEWVKFRSVRGWVIAMIVAVLAIVALGLGPGMQGSCGMNGPASDCTQPLGPGGEPVTDSFYFVHRPLGANGSITVAMTSLTGLIPNFSGDGGGGGGGGAGGPQTRAGLVPWAKAGIIIKASTGQGSAYAAMMVTGGNGVRMQYDYTGDVAAPPAPGAVGAVSAASPRWLRLTRSGATLTGYDSADGRHWTKVAAVTLAGLPATVLAGLFATSPQYSQVSGASVSGGPSQATGVFDRLSLRGTGPGGAWTSSAIVVIEGQRLLRDHGVYVWPVTALTEARVIVGTAAVLAVAAVIALAIGAVLRRSAGAVAAVIVLIVLPYLLTVAIPILPAGPADWLARVTPAAAFAVQGTLVQYPQVSNVYTPSAGYYPLAPWAGFAVLCAWAAVALAVAAYLLHRRDA